MKKVFFGALIALALAAPTYAALSEQYKDWHEGPVKWLLTDQEMKEYKSIKTDEEAQNFIDLFWARRDPTPGTPINEMKLGFEQRVEIANERWASGKTAGALTDRGRVFLLLGAPNRLGRTSNAPESTHQSGMSSNAIDNARGTKAPTEVWYYEKENRPAVGGDIDFDVSFIDYYGNNDWKMVMTGKRGVNDLLLKARDYFIAQPGLEMVPDYSMTATTPVVNNVEVEEVATEFTNDYLKSLYDDFKRQAIAAEDDLHLTYGEYVTPAGQYFVPVQLYIPGNAGIDTSGELTFFGVVEKADGEIVAVYEEPVTLLASNADSYYDMSLMLQPGEYVGTFGLARDNKAVAIAKTDLALEGLDETEASVSDLILSNNIFALTEAQAATDPYAFGGLKVVPKGDATFGAQEELWYFFEARNPGLNEEGKPQFRVKLDVEGKKADGSAVKMGAPMMEVNAEPVKDTEGHFMVGSSFPAGAFPPGNYTLKAKIFDSVAKQTWNIEKEFRIVE